MVDAPDGRGGAAITATVAKASTTNFVAILDMALPLLSETYY
jgi:hypothetical protein